MREERVLKQRSPSPTPQMGGPPTVPSGVRAVLALCHSCRVKAMFSVFPAGAAGVALLFLRLACAGLWFSALVFAAALPLWLAVAGGLVACALVLGFLTRIATTMTIVAIVVARIELSGALGALTLLHLLDAGALLLLGAGAYSLDARLFGRREIRIDG